MNISTALRRKLLHERFYNLSLGEKLIYIHMSTTGDVFRRECFSCSAFYNYIEELKNNHIDCFEYITKDNYEESEDTRTMLTISWKYSEMGKTMMDLCTL